MGHTEVRWASRSRSECRSRNHPRALLATLLIFATWIAGTSMASAVLVVGGTTNVAYTEQQSAKLIAEGLTFTGGTSYDGEYLEFSISDATTAETLALVQSGSPVTTNGVISVVGSSIYLGDGTNAEAVASVDGVSNGALGENLRVNFTSDFQNAGFESGTLDGWTAIESRVDLGVTELAGFTTSDTATYPANNAAGNDDAAPSTLGTLTVTPSTASVSEGTYSLELSSTGMTTANGCDVVHGPAVYSGQFQAAAGDSIYFDWRALSGADAYHVFGYIIDEFGTQTEVLDALAADASGSTPWVTKQTVIPASGTYRFVFVAGTHDYSCGRAAGASLYIDNVKVFGSKVNDSVVQSIARLVTYANNSDAPASIRTVTVTAKSVAEGIDSSTFDINITAVDDPPTIDAPAAVAFANAEGDDSFVSVPGTFAASDPDLELLTRALTDAETGVWTVEGNDYTERVAGTFATVYLDPPTGDYLVVPNDSAIEAVASTTSESHGISASASGQTAVATFDVQVTVETVPGLVRNVVVGERSQGAAISWESPDWSGGSAVLDYIVEYSTDGSSWTTFADGISSSTGATVTGLTNGLGYTFRIGAVNGTGVGSVVVTSEVTAGLVAGSPENPVAQPAAQSVLVSWDPPSSDGGSAILDYVVEHSTDGSSWVTFDDGVSSSTGATVTGLTNGVGYVVRISAVNAVGTGPASAASPEATPRTVPGAPVNLVAVEGLEMVIVSWDQPSSDGGVAVSDYVIEYSTDGISWTIFADGISSTTGATVTGLTSDVGYFFRVAAINVAGLGPRAESSVAAVPFSGYRPGEWLSDDWDDDASDVYDDVAPGRFYHEPVSWAHHNEIVYGRSSGVLDPDANVTRAEFVTMIYRMMDQPDVAESSPFDDVAAGAYYIPALDWAVSAGIIFGATPTTFEPDAHLTRGQLAAIVHRLALLPEPDVTTRFGDVPGGSFFERAASWLAQTGLLNDDGVLEPYRPTTRGESVTVLWRLNTYDL